MCWQHNRDRGWRLLCVQVEADGRTLVSENGDVIPDVDIIFFATGFDQSELITNHSVWARGCDLKETLKARPEAYYGLAMAGFPNLFSLMGYNTGDSHRAYFLDRSMLEPRPAASYL